MKSFSLRIVHFWTAAVVVVVVILSSSGCSAWTTKTTKSICVPRTRFFDTSSPFSSSYTLVWPSTRGLDVSGRQGKARQSVGLYFSSSSNHNNYRSRRAKAAAAANRRRERRAADRRAQGKEDPPPPPPPPEARRWTTKQSAESMLTFIETPQTSTVNPGESDARLAKDEASAPLVRTILRAADLRKAQDCVALRVSGATALCTFVVLVSGNSRPQNQAIAAAIMEDVEEGFDGLLTKSNGVPEGTADSGWILLDCGDVMVHIMTPKSRLFYDLEGQWREKGAEYMDVSDVLVPNAPLSSVVTYDDDDDDDNDDGFSSSPPPLGGGMANIPEEDDPFWS